MSSNSALWLRNHAVQHLFAQETTWSRELIMSLLILLLSLALAFFKLRTSWLSSTAHREAADNSASTSTTTVKKGLSDETLRDWQELRTADVSDVRVSRLLIHPIKSCKGTPVQEANYTPEGLEFDRKLVIVTASNSRFITAREIPKLVLIHPQVRRDDSDEELGDMMISFPEDSGCESFSIPLVPSQKRLQSWERLEDVSVWSDKVEGFVVQSKSLLDPYAPSRKLSQFIGKDVHLVYKGPRPRHCKPTPEFPGLSATAVFQDGYPLLVASEESLRSTQTKVRGQVGVQGVEERWAQEELEMTRFRPNIVIKGAGMPWAEDVWQCIQIGQNSSPISLVSKCTRCLLPNVDPSTGIRDKAVPYKVLMKFRTGKDPTHLNQPCFGVNGVPHGSGTIRVGDSVSVLEFLPE